MNRTLKQWWVAGALAAVLILLGIFAPRFFRPEQLVPMLTAAAPVLLVAAGVSTVILTRQIDVSLGSQFGWCSVLAGLTAASGAPMPVVALVSIVTGMGLGAFNGALVAGLGLPSIVVTLATLVTWREALRWSRQGEYIRDLPISFQWLGLSQATGQVVIIGSCGALFLLLVLALKFTAGGRFFYAVGSDEDAARLAGLRPRLVTFGAFLLSGSLVGLAALLNAVRFNDIDPKTGQGLEMQAIAAAVVGGIAISGGRGSLWGVLAGVLLLATVAPALVFLNIPPQWERAIQGAIILLAVAAEARRR
jgi:rhamnose transport system permease protein